MRRTLMTMTRTLEYEEEDGMDPRSRTLSRRMRTLRTMRILGTRWMLMIRMLSRRDKMSKIVRSMLMRTT